MFTPKKKVPENCFLCDRKRFYSVDGKNSFDILSKLSLICKTSDNSLESVLLDRDYGICRSCFDNIDTTFTYVKSLNKKISELTKEEPTSRFKRMSSSPSTPESQSQTTIRNYSKNFKKTRRTLFISNVSNKPAVNAEFSRLPVQSSFSITSTSTVDHEYSLKPENAHTSSKFSGLGQSGSTLGILKTCLKGEASNRPSISETVKKIFSNPVLLKAVKSKLIDDIDKECSILVSNNPALCSVLSRYRSVKSLVDNGDNLIDEIILEISTRIPFVLDLLTVMTTAGKEPAESKIAPVAAAYSILMNSRNNQLSAWHRMTTFVAIKGHLDDSALVRLNHLSLTMSPSSKLRLLDEAGELMNAGIASKVITNPLVKITGDNLDIYVRTGHQSMDRSNKDLHLFVSNIIFSRIAKPGQYSLVADPYPLSSLQPEMFFPRGHFQQTLRNTYCILLGRMLSELKAFSWLKPVLPAHIYHPYHTQMSQKSHVYQLPIMLKNEAKHEECVDIMDEYESTLGEIFTKAFAMMTTVILVLDISCQIEYL
ncbi:uncharacterized protein LOC132730884 isoform X2 [Ruditapes philippinarum]|uniref:uncharacterized protein LOC132730884 isoform X2 n=1 Tax=Ruditapes philippinarum TaxID=129788 RepID=UPI00295B3E17|nr:uncharacterized protein LOC132730884 isoform X2 [Ruditapes philippinarum]